MTLLDLFDRLGRYLHFALLALWSALLAVTRPPDALRQFHHVLLGILPLGVAAGLAIGAVLWLQLHAIFERFGAKPLLPQAMALAVVLEFAPTGAGLIAAGRTGASLGAELGSMRLTEQIDALEVLGQSPLRVLVGPRVLACMLALPLLTVFISGFALAGSYAAEALGGRLSWTQYWNACLRGLRLGDVIPATLKTVVFGYLVGVTGCYYGMTATGGTEGVGRAATRGVVTSTFLVLTANVLLVKLIQVATG